MFEQFSAADFRFVVKDTASTNLKIFAQAFDLAIGCAKFPFLGHRMKIFVARDELHHTSVGCGASKLDLRAKPRCFHAHISFF